MFITLAVLVGVGIFTSSPVIEVSDVLAVDHARLPMACVGEVAVLDSMQTREVRNRRTEALNFVMVKTWAASESVLIKVTDPDDPHPAWLISTRHPGELTAAINARATSAG